MSDLPSTSREDHLAWSKKRALEYLDTGDVQGAFASMVSDLRKHPETAEHPGMTLGLMEMMFRPMSAPAMREHIEGYH